MDINEYKYKCCICNEIVEFDFLLEAHLATTHVFYTPYQCELCQSALFPTDHSLREHYQTMHNLNVYNVKYKVSPELDKRRDLLQKLMSQSRAICAKNLTVKPQFAELAFCNSASYTTQLLQTCTAQLLQEQLAQTAEFIANKQNYEMNNVNNTDDDEIEGQQTMEANTSGTSAETSHLNFGKIFVSPNIFGVGNVDFEMDSVASTPTKKITQNADNFIIDAQSNTVGSKKRGRHKKTDNDNPENSNSQMKDKDETTENGTGEADKSQMVECVDCKRKVGKYRNSMLIHTSTHHCDQPIFECLDGNCNKKWYSLSARTKEHIEVYHGGNHSLLKDNRPELLWQLKTKTARLFPDFYTFGGKLDIP